MKLDLNVALEPETLQEAISLFDVVLNESERGAVIACCSKLEELIDENFLQGSKAPFSFYQKISFLKSNFIQQDLCELLDIMRDIRNDAAHSSSRFSLDSYGQTFHNNLVAKGKKYNLYKTFRSCKLSPDTQKQLTILGKRTSSPKTLGELVDIAKMIPNKAHQFEFYMIFLIVYGYLQAGAVSPFAKLKQAIPKFT